MSPSIDASHIATQISAELIAAQDERWRRIDAAKPAAKSASPKSTPPKPAGKAAQPKPAAPKPQPRIVAKKSAPKPPPDSVVSLPPGSVVVSAAEMEAIDDALDYWVANHAKRHR